MISKIKEGDRFGWLVVIKDSGNRKHRHKIYECVCDCGNIHYVKSINLTQGVTKSCGCQQYLKGRKHIITKPIIKKASIDSIGITINRLTLIDLKKEIRQPLIAVLRCTCGSIIERNYKEFKKGNIKSCGCLSKEISAQAIIHKKNIKAFKALPKRPRKVKSYTPKIDYTGRKQGMLTILYWCGIRITKAGAKIALWYCKCECGKHIIKSTTALKNPKASCGCNLYEARRERGIKVTKGNINRIKKFLKEEWYPRDEIDHKNRRFRQTIKKELFNKQPYGCAICGYMGDTTNQLCAHHYKPHALFPKFRYTLANLVLLCRNCHDELHKTLGYNCTSIPMQIEYINNTKTYHDANK